MQHGDIIQVNNEQRYYKIKAIKENFIIVIEPISAKFFLENALITRGLRIAKFRIHLF